MDDFYCCISPLPTLREFFVYTYDTRTPTVVLLHSFTIILSTKSIWLICIHSDAAIESIDIPRILSQQGGEAVYPLPRIKAIEFHPKSNLAALVFAVTCYLAFFMPYVLVENIVWNINKLSVYFDRM